MITEETLFIISLYEEGDFDDAESVESLADWMQEHYDGSNYPEMEEFDFSKVDWVRAAMAMMRRPDLPGVVLAAA